MSYIEITHKSHTLSYAERKVLSVILPYVLCSTKLFRPTNPFDTYIRRVGRSDSQDKPVVVRVFISKDRLRENVGLVGAQEELIRFFGKLLPEYDWESSIEIFVTDGTQTAPEVEHAA